MRRYECEEILENIAAEVRTSDDNLVREEDLRRQTAAEESLNRAIAALEPEDRLLLRLRFESDLPVSRIASVLRADQKKLYRRVEKLLKQLRDAMESTGLTADEVSRMIASGTVCLRLDFDVSNDWLGSV
jgi:RNA polymerase sigma factor (sigma-70 family)